MIRDFRTVNDELFSYKHIVIYGASREARYIFWQSFYDENLYIDGFVDDRFCKYKIYNKSIFSEEDVLQMEDCAILLSVRDVEDFLQSAMSALPVYVDHFTKEMDCRIRPLFTFEKLLGRINIIYGCGFYGKEVFRELDAQQINIDFYCDSDEDKHGEKIHARKILSLEEARQIKNKKNIVIAASAWKDIADKIDSDDLGYIYTDYYTYMLSTGQIGCWIYPDDIMHDFDLIFLLKCAKGKKIITFGDERKAELIRLILKQTGLLITGYEHIDDFYDLHYVDKSKVVAINCSVDSAKSEKILLQAGFKSGKNYLKALGCVAMVSYWYRDVSDALLGRTYVVANQYPGFTYYKSTSKSENKVKIVTIGGSTTDAKATSFSCWSEKLHDICAKNGIECEVICGGIAGYRSGNELLKLYRDIVKLKPDIVISYSGYNNVFNLCYLQEIYKDNTWMDTVMFENSQIIRQNSHLIYDAGIHLKEAVDALDLWIYDEEIEAQICAIKDIKFFSIFQPSMFTYNGNDTDYEEYLLNYNLIDITREKARLYDLYDVSNMKNRIKKLGYNWLYDLTDLFDRFTFSDVYIDSCHTTEYGNEIIADKIFSIIKNIL